MRRARPYGHYYPVTFMLSLSKLTSCEFYFLFPLFFFFPQSHLEPFIGEINLLWLLP